MPPPSSTPDPRRFLLAKRGVQASQAPSTPPQFHSTPRFGASSVTKSAQARTSYDVEDVEDADDLVQESSLSEGEEDDDDDEDSGKEPQTSTRARIPLNDSIEIESDVGTSSSLSPSPAAAPADPESDGRHERKAHTPIKEDLPEGMNAWSEGSPIKERSPKRRKISISPTSPPSLPDGQHQLDHEAVDVQSVTSEISAVESFAGSTRDGDGDALAANIETKATQQPTFRHPPRFKPVETDDAAYGLPAAFSPQRRGAKYLAGGLAAELQGWLSEVKGWEGAGRAADDAITKVVVEEVRPGRRMYLVRGRAHDARQMKTDRFLLAGEGRLTGLNRRSAVEVGSVVELGQPTWEVELDDATWLVACDWSVS